MRLLYKGKTKIDLEGRFINPGDTVSVTKDLGLDLLASNPEAFEISKEFTSQHNKMYHKTVSFKSK